MENAFKHGVSYNNPSFIHMKIDYADGRSPARSATAATTQKSERRHAAGIGLDNVRKRLELIYGPKNYSLEIRERKTYTVKLVIPTLNA